VSLIRRTHTLSERQLSALKAAAKARGHAHGVSEALRRIVDDWIEANKEWLVKHGWRSK
jgi:hypothetical protein